MGWLFSRRKKKKKSKSSAVQKGVESSFHDDQSFSFDSVGGSDSVIKPDQFKAAAGFEGGDSISPSSPLDGGLGEVPSSEDVALGSNDGAEPDLGSGAWGDLSQTNEHLRMGESNSGPKMLGEETELPANPRPALGAARRMASDYKYVQVHVYKRILGELHDLQEELAHMGSLGKSLDKAEYNEEKHFLRLKDIMRKVHDKTLQSDRVLFSHNQ